MLIDFEKMRGQIRGLNQASRNIQEGISLVQTAEGGLNEVHDLLQRGRELAVQASNGTNTEIDKQSIQNEINQISEEIDCIVNTTHFNGISLLDTSNVSSDDKQKVIDNLQRSWLKSSEQLVFDTYGINGGGTNFKITLQDTIDGAGNTATRVMYSYILGVTTTGSNIELQVDMEDFHLPTFPNGGTAPFYSDRIIAYEMTHAVMAANVNVTSDMQTWFMEETEEALQGADERLSVSLSSLSSQ